MQEDIKLEVAEAREAPEQHPQWEFEDDEDEEDSKEEESDDEFATDSAVSYTHLTLPTKRIV